MTDKTASIHWEGRGKQGVGKISTQTDALKSYPYGYGSRFEDDRRGFAVSAPWWDIVFGTFSPRTRREARGASATP